ncbi:sulfurtransferase TusA family protein [bacterium]|nr:sulfurtransferase TusA family protein [bacterium]
MNEEKRETILVDVIGQTCPFPLIEMRKAILKAKKGDIIIIRGDHPQSQHEIPMGAKAMDCEIIKNEIDDKGVWTIEIKK